MLKVPPPVWALVYVLIGVAISWSLGWPRLLGPQFAPLGIALVAVAWIPPVWAIVLFRREGTEVDPTSPANRSALGEQAAQLRRGPPRRGELAELPELPRKP